MNEPSNLPPIFSTTESKAYEESGDDPVDPSLMQSFRDDLLSSFDNIAPKVSQLERTFAKTITRAQSIKSKSNFNFSDQLNDIQIKMKEMHHKSIDLSRKVQSLTLTSQTSSALAAPRLLRPVNDSFCDFREEFDHSLKNLATLSTNINEKSQNLSSSLENMTKLPKSVEIMKSDIASLLQKCTQNEKTIEKTKDQVSKMLSDLEREVCADIDDKISDADEMIKKMDKMATKGMAEADSLSSRMQNDKETLQKSFSSLTAEIENATSQKLQKLNTAIEAASRRGNSLIESIQNQLSEEFDQIMKNESIEQENSILDQIEQAREESQIVALLNKLDQLQEKIQNLEKNDDNTTQTGSFYEEDENENENNEENDVEVFTKIIDNKTYKFFCRPDGTFTMEIE
ncbi:hypothetical protein TRFO_01276 [Tritrichomonas foetus]|uniref:Uncharacterized protein n=1 Tax=Tritrichomonas foetus TaxID=1144522 RepID=A0A1J4K853_9EUKA|nr:hypothetical protein TRFO_01276 [Tritrichomonas foetus]|eukprot:OHT07154.1 hypothetical protein TRFO_01276 [Tritrichomonas foetus]